MARELHNVLAGTFSELYTHRFIYIMIWEIDLLQLDRLCIKWYGSAFREDMVKINMDLFVQRFQPDRYELWREGKDYGCHPEDPHHHKPAPHPDPEQLKM